MNNLIKKAKLNGWKIKKDCAGKVVIYVPFRESIKVIQNLKKRGDNITTLYNHDFSVCAVSFL